MFGYGFPQELEDAIDATTAKFGPIECAKKFLFYFMTESGVHDGDVVADSDGREAAPVGGGVVPVGSGAE